MGLMDTLARPQAAADARLAIAGVATEELAGLPPPEQGGRRAVRRPSGGRLRQAVAYAITLFALVTVTFVLPRAMPGDPLDALLDSTSPNALQDPLARSEQAAYYGLDQPLAVQYWRYLGDLVRGDFGVSIRYSEPVADLVRNRLPWTLLLISSALVVAVVAGVLAGVHAGWRRNRPIDRGLLALFLAFRAFPEYFVASLALFVFSARLGWFPLGGEATVFSDYGLATSILDVVHHLALPMLVLAAHFSAGYYLLTRAGMVGELGADYLRMGRAKGLPERWLKYRYAARNALLPVVTLGAVHFGAAVSAAVFVEKVFAYKGLGLLMVEAVDARDYPTLQACFLLLSVIVVTVNFAADLLYRRIDPRTAP